MQLVIVRPGCSDDAERVLLVSIIDSGHLEALYGGQEGWKEAVLV